MSRLLAQGNRRNTTGHQQEANLTGSFDAYHTWLGIRPEDQPPNHYRLLGIEPFEADPAVIDHAAEQRMVYLRTLQIGRNSSLSQKLMNEVAVAKICLLNPEKKAAYDRHLRESQRTSQAPLPPPVLPISAVAQSPITSNSNANSTDAEAAASNRLYHYSTWIVAIGTISLLAIVGFVVHIWPGASSDIPQPSVNSAKVSIADSSALASGNESRAHQEKKVTPTAASAEPIATEADLRSSQQGPETSPSTTPGSGEPEVSEHAATESDLQPDRSGKPATPTIQNVAGSPENVAPAPAPPPLSPEAATRLPVPSDAIQAEIAQRIDSVFKVADAKTRQERLKVAGELYELGRNSQGDSNEQFVLLRRAMEVAGEAGDAAIMLETVDAIGERFEIDTWKAKLVVLEGFAKNANTSDRVVGLIEAIASTVDQALAAKRYHVAFQLIDLAYSASSRSAGAKYRKEVFDRRKRIEELRDGWQAAETASIALAANPNDPEANFALARWYCLIERDWEKGLPFAARCRDEAFRTLAEQELQVAADNPEARSKLADGWWDFANQESGDAKEAIRAHAGELYRHAQPHLPAGLAKATAEKRLAELAPAAPKTDLQQVEVPEEAGSSVSPNATAATPTGKLIPAAVDTELRLPKNQGPYQLAGKVVVLKSGTLLIERGTVILAAPGASLVAAGKIASYGEGDEFVEFRPAMNASWEKIQLDPGIQHQLQRFDVRGANTGVELSKEATVELADCIFTQNKIGVAVIRCNGVTCLKNCLIAGNVSHGITFHMCKVLLDHCTVASNGEVGLNMTYEGNLNVSSCNIVGNGTGIQSNLYQTHLTMTSSNILGNRGPAVWLRTAEDFQCLENYWGTKNPQEIAMMIKDGYDEPSHGVVRYENFKSKPFEDAGCSIELPKAKRRGR